MKQMMCVILSVLVAGSVFGQNEPGNEEILDVLEEINEKLERLAPDEDQEWGEWDEGQGSGRGFGGGPFLAVRWIVEMDELNGYLKDIGSFHEDRLFRAFLFPFVDGGGGTWRVSLSDRMQFGIASYGYGQETWGYLNHTEDTKGADNTVDEDGDGYDDYVSYVEWGFGGANFLLEYRMPLSPQSIYLEIGGVFGMGGEGLTIERSPRQVSSIMENLLAVQVLTGQSDWSRMYFTVGGFTGLQIAFPKTKGIVKLGLEAGIDYHIPMDSGGKWTPGVGIHRKEKAPPADFNSMNVWFHIGPQFNY